MIGFFDSGFGGLTVMKEYLKKYPEFDYMYLGDQANMPYGSHSKEHVNKLAAANVDFLIKKGCTLIIIACNTASADALRHVQQIYKGKPTILGVLVPAAEEALRKTRFGNIGVIGTRGTIGSGAYERELNKYATEFYKPTEKRAGKTIRVYSQACPLLVPLVEEGMIKHVVTRMMLRKYLRPLKHAHVDTLILGCTHYPLLQKEIERVMGKQVQVISSATAAANAIDDYFERHPDIKNGITTGGTRTYYTTDCPERFSDLGSRFLGEKIEGEKIEI
ncbi:glutamate racemase [Candidatus Peregrinibacteria bacterium CG_4_10_14_0_2_um_filter_43_11]|nr:MAG: glutamate racemase [Candidatus Peregrinibacteria bacterium CG_4_10_14_0_2_um_filter_43_11]